MRMSSIVTFILLYSLINILQTLLVITMGLIFSLKECSSGFAALGGTNDIHRSKLGYFSLLHHIDRECYTLMLRVQLENVVIRIAYIGGNNVLRSHG